MSRSPPHPDEQMIALGIQQPWAELILRGIKTIEVRSLGTRVRGRVYLYASKRASKLPAAAQAVRRFHLNLDALPQGMLVGTIEIVTARPSIAADAASACLPANLMVGKQSWLLAQPQRLSTPLPVRFLPYGVWFYPFRRKSDSCGSVSPQ